MPAKTKTIMNDLQINIINQLRNNHRGKDNAVTYKRLASVLGINDRLLRQAVAELITYYHYPIASSQEGYWYIASDDEYLQASRELLSRIKMLSLRHKGLRVGYLKSKQDYKPKQLELIC